MHTLLLAALLLATPAPRLDAAVEAAMKAQRIPGAAVAVVRGGRVIHAKGYGWADLEQRVPVTGRTRFMTGSVAKQLTAAAVLLLAEEGKLGLDDPLARFFPECAERWRGITIRHLLNHTAGVRDYEGLPLAEVPAATEAAFVGWACAQAPDFAPGAAWAYSNTGYVLLGALVQRASGRFYGDLLAERLWKPLGMSGTRLLARDALVEGRARGYELRDGALVNETWLYPDGAFLASSADGSLYQTLDDLVRWDAAVRGRKVLSAASWREAFAPAPLTGGATHPYGMAWDLRPLAGRPAASHGGSFMGFNAFYARLVEDDLTVIVLTNLGTGRPSGAVAEAVAAVLLAR